MQFHTLDARHLLCPMPVIKVQAFIETVSDGDIIDVVCTDPGALYDIPAWAKVHGHEVQSTEESDGEISIKVKVNKLPDNQ